MKVQPNFCRECGLSFVLVERSEVGSTCVLCLGKMLPPYKQCDECKRAIERGERFHLEWSLLCNDCVHRLNRTLHRPPYYELTSIVS